MRPKTARNLTAATDPRGLVTRTTYNQYGQPTSTTDPLGNTSTIAYDNRGLPASTTDALGNRTTFTYDRNGNILTVRDSAGTLLVTNTYSPFNDLLTSTPAGGGRTTTFTYDLEGRRTSSSVTDPDSGMILRDKTVYDDAGRVIGSSREKVAQTFLSVISATSSTYDDNGKLLTAGTSSPAFERVFAVVRLSVKRGRSVWIVVHGMTCGFRVRRGR